jgi:hypothetical protein
LLFVGTVSTYRLPDLNLLKTTVDWMGAARKQLIFVGSLYGNENEELMDEG